MFYVLAKLRPFIFIRLYLKNQNLLAWARFVSIYLSMDFDFSKSHDKNDAKILRTLCAIFRVESDWMNYVSMGSLDSSLEDPMVNLVFIYKFLL